MLACPVDGQPVRVEVADYLADGQPCYGDEITIGPSARECSDGTLFVYFPTAIRGVSVISDGDFWREVPTERAESLANACQPF